MTAPIRCFLLTPTESVRVSLRRYASSLSATPCSKRGSYCNSSVAIGDEARTPESKPVGGGRPPSPAERADHRWPTVCDLCGYLFAESDEWQVNRDRLWVRSDDGPSCTLHGAPPGAMWIATWMEETDWPKGPDGRVLVVRLPDGTDWMPDSRASNCTMKNDTVHRCWPRHGDPPNVTVDKSGNTCSAGAGSIAAPGWHGFLRNGHLVTC